MNECNHEWQKVEEPHKAVREFVIELRCVRCAARKIVEASPVWKIEVVRSSKGKRLNTLATV